MIDKDKLTGKTQLSVFYEYLRENFPDVYPTAEDLSEFKRGEYSGKVIILRFLESICEKEQ